MPEYKFAIHIGYIHAGKMNPQEEKQFFQNEDQIWTFLGYLKKSDYIVTHLKVYSLKEVPFSG